MGKLQRFVKQLSQRYTDYIEHHGMGLVTAACAVVIIGSAVWTHANEPKVPAAPVFPAENAQSAADLLQQSLEDVQQPSAQPTAPAPEFVPPVVKITVLNHFDATRLQQSASTGLWYLHDAVDLVVAPGEQIFSISDGTVIAVSDDSLHGSCLEIDHGNGTFAFYMGLKAAAGLRAGDPVSTGQTIGFGGNGMMEESSLPAHLHLRVLQHGKAINPLSLWESAGL